MSKRKLSKQQQARISANQFNELDGQRSSDSAVEQIQGVVISHFGQQLDVEMLDVSTSQTTTVRCFQRSNLPSLVTGDRVVVQCENENEAVVIAVAPRKNEFLRPGFKGKLKPVAANIDRVLLVIASLPEPFTNLIDRYLVAIASLNLSVAIVFNKTDLVTPQTAEKFDNIMSIYKSVGYEVYKVSAEANLGIEALESGLFQQTTVLVGQSGVGKSSLVNRLSAGHRAETGPLSLGKEKGTHTTTTARLFHLPAFDLIDSPGIREFSLGHITAEQLMQGYPDLSVYANQCKFRDCRHRSEPGCAIQAAKAKGLIATERLANYFQILESIED